MRVESQRSLNVDLEYGIYYSKSADLILSSEEAAKLQNAGVPPKYFKMFIGSNEFINGTIRYWIN